jgi:hypothetical protein
MTAPASNNEKQRLAALRNYKILDTAREKALGELLCLAESEWRAPFSEVSHDANALALDDGPASAAPVRGRSRSLSYLKATQVIAGALGSFADYFPHSGILKSTGMSTRLWIGLPFSRNGR